MPEEFDEGGEDLEQPPAFFPYEADSPTGEAVDYGEPVEVSVEGVFAVENNGTVQQFVLLSDGTRKVPILIGAFEATAITLALEGKTPDRPMTHDLLKTIMDRLEGELDRVVIDDLWSTTFYAKLYVLNVDGEEMCVDARPSDAIALALRCDASVFVADGILDQSGGL
jgi:bifunctional DNase/RNase